MFRALKPYQLVVDAAIAVAFFIAVYNFPGSNPTGLPEQGLILGMSVVLLLRRLSPGGALVIAWMLALLQMYVAHIPPSISDLAILPALYATSAYGNRLLRWLGLASVGLGAALGSLYLAFSGTAYLFGLNFDFSSVTRLAAILVQFAFLAVAMLVLLGLPWTLGQLVRTRIQARASREAQAAAELEAQVAEQDVIVEQERNRIARDMHDVVAHSLAVVIAQADGARYASRKDPAAVDDALNAISSTAREALGDVRLLLGQLRHSQAEGPQPSLAELSRLIEQLRASGLDIEMDSIGHPLALGNGQQLAIYRIVQEALTNVLRHGDVGKRAFVRFVWTAHDLEVTITSSLLSSPRTAELRVGHGLAGMRERAALVGGQLTTAVSDQKFVVRASVPSTPVAVQA
ncbi:MAG: sensor histidine kinase [Glaciihabitans sp.]|nr:sensor histidine kinase [Glaciihabitans sp.]